MVFNKTTPDRAAGHRLLGQDLTDDDDDLPQGRTIWERKSTSDERNETAIDPEIWEQDPLHQSGEQDHELQRVAAFSGSSRYPGGGAGLDASGRRLWPKPEDLSGVATELNDEFQRIFTPMKKDQEDRARFHAEVDAACAAYWMRLDDMREQQREREATISTPWLLARRRRRWQRMLATARVVATVATCYWGGTAAELPEVPPEVPWPPPHLERIREGHAEERKALREAHLGVVRELQLKHNFDVRMGDDTAEDGADGAEVPPKEHVCVERSLLVEVFGEGVIPHRDTGSSV